MQGLVTSAVVTVVWVTVGYSLAFGPGDFIGDLHWGGLTGVNANGDQDDRFITTHYIIFPTM